MTIKLTNQYHQLKLAEEYRQPVREGIKTFEIRNNDRNYRVGDRLSFRGITSLYVITYLIQNIPQYGLQPGYCLFAFRKLEPKDIEKGEITV